MILWLLLLPVASAVGPCYRPYGGCRPNYYGGVYGQQPYQHMGYGISPYGQQSQYVQYPSPHSGGSYVTPPPTPHPTQSSMIVEHVTQVPPASTTEDLSDIFDEFNGRDEELLRLRTETNSLHNQQLYLKPLQPPHRAQPYRPTILSQSHDAVSESLDNTADGEAVEGSGFIPQPVPAKPLPDVYTQTTTERNPFPYPLDTVSRGPSSSHLIPSIPSGGSYVVAPSYPRPQPPRQLPPSTSYVRPLPFVPHGPRPLPITYGGVSPYAVRPVPLPRPLPCQPLPLPHPQPYPQPTYTRVQGAYATGVAPHPPFVDCCGKCRSPCKYRAKRQLAAKLFDPSGKKIDIPPTKDGRCTSETLRYLMMKTTTSTPSLSKRIIQKAAEEQFGGYFSVFCSKEDFAYASRASLYCQTSKNDVVCFAFQHQ